MQVFLATMSESIVGTTFIAEWVNDGVGVKITIKNGELKNLNDSKKRIISMVSVLFKQLEESDISENSCDKKLCVKKQCDKKLCDKKPSDKKPSDKKPSDKKPCTDASPTPSDKEKMTFEKFIQACISCLNDKKKIGALDMCNPTSNKHLPKSYELIRDSDNVILNFKQKIDLLRTNSHIQYDESTKILSLKE